MRIGYARVSTVDQTLALQRDALTAAGCERIFTDHGIGGTATTCPGLDRALKALKPGDTLIVWKLDRLARSTRDLLNTLAAVTGKRAGFRSLGDAWADTTTPHGRSMLHVLDGLTAFERDLIRARTGEGPARAKARGVRLGRPQKLTAYQKREALERYVEGEALSDIAHSYNVGRSTMTRLAAPIQARQPLPPSRGDVHALTDEPLRWPSYHGHTETVKLLLDAGADVHARNDDALRGASKNGHTETVKLLLDAGADVHAQNDAALRWASMDGHTEIVKLLLDAGADVHAEDDIALRWASAKGHSEIVKLLLDAGADLHAADDIALRWASKNGHTETVKLLLDAGADIHAAYDYALRQARYYGHTETVKLLETAVASAAAAS